MNMTLYEELKWRGLLKDISNEEQAIHLLNGEPVKFYCGFDPSADSLTVGHLVQIVRMMLLQKHGHIPVALIGGATGLIGDPRQTSERKLLTLEESLENAKKIEKQLKSFLDQGQAMFVNNYDWIKNIDMISFLRDYGKFFNINYMLAKETVAKRLDIGISYTEFSYMILQAIDFLHLYETIDCKIQFGGSDQWGNITSGLELIRKVHGDTHQAIGLSSPLLLKSDGSKFGKSESGALWLDDQLTSAYEIYQYFLNVSDSDVIHYLKTLTLLDRATIEALDEKTKQAPELRSAQKALAEEVVKMMHGQEALEDAIKVTNALFSGTFDELSASSFNIVKQILDHKTLNKKVLIVDALIETKLAQSKREAREFVKSGAVFINGVKIESVEWDLSQVNTYFDQFMIIRRGKKKYAMIIVS